MNTVCLVFVSKHFDNSDLHHFLQKNVRSLKQIRVKSFLGCSENPNGDLKNNGQDYHSSESLFTRLYFIT